MRLVVPIVLVLCALGAAACGGDDDNGTGEQASSGEAQFALHAGRALGAFRTHILQPYQAGKLQEGGDAALATAARAGDVATEELGLARQVAAESGSLRPHLLAPTDDLHAKLRPLVVELKSGSVSPGSVLTTAAAVAALDTAAAAYGLPIKDQPVPISGT